MRKYVGNFHKNNFGNNERKKFGYFDGNGVWCAKEYHGPHGDMGTYLDYRDPDNLGHNAGFDGIDIDIYYNVIQTTIGVSVQTIVSDVYDGFDFTYSI